MKNAFYIHGLYLPKWWYAIYASMLVTSILAFASPAFAGSDIDFAPASPVVYDGSSDVDIGCDLVGTNYWAIFKPDETVLQSGYVFASCNGPLSADYGGNLQSFAAGPGDVTFVYVLGYGGDCTFGTLSDCLASSNYSLAGSVPPVIYTLCDGTCPDPDPDPDPEPEISDTATSSVDQTQQNIFNMYWSFLATVFFVVWFLRPRT